MVIDYPVIIISFLLSFLIVLLAMPYWIRRAHGAGLVGRDMHKRDGRNVANLGGLVVVCAFIFGTLAYVAIDTFVIAHKDPAIFLQRDLQIMAALVTLLLLTVLGLVDDILGWKIGLRQWQKPVFALFAAIPLAVVNAGQTTMALPLIGKLDIGILFPIVIIPLAVSGASNGFNMIGGYNGLESGMGALILAALAYFAWLTDHSYAAVLALCMVFALLAFYVYNRCPAKVFPGNVLTYAVGGLIATVAILGNVERIALVLFLPYFIEFILKARGHFRKESFAKVTYDGSLDAPYQKIYGLEHLAIRILKQFKRHVSEPNVVHAIFAFEIALMLFVYLLYRVL
ncbi:MAG TPA: glycosyl transferase family 4 [Nanoarchaeota archaeon]|nr:glycosyl transferase family 4 [Nanoarchaeota archaeon]